MEDKNTPAPFLGIDLPDTIYDFPPSVFKVWSNGEDITHECHINANGVIDLGERFMIEDVEYEEVTNQLKAAED